MDARLQIEYLPGDLAKRQMVSSWSRLLLLVIAAAVLIGATIWLGWSWWTSVEFIASTDDAYVGGEVTTLSSRVAGFIETIAILDNQRLKAGDLLVKIEDRDYRAQLARAWRASRPSMRPLPISMPTGASSKP